MIQYGYAPRHVDPSPTRLGRWSRQLAAVAAVALALVASVAFATPASAAPTSVVVRSNDTLWAIAGKYCGSPYRWTSLAAGNGISDPRTIRPGRVLKLTCSTPARTTGTTASRSTTRTTTVPSSGWVNPLPGVRLTSCWGDGRGHKGLDMDGYYGQPVRAAASGTVSNVGWIGTGYGLEVVIDHGNGIWSHYAHLSKTSVHKGQRVTAGQTIAAVGNSGAVVRGPNGDGSHLHFEVARSARVYGTQINPAPWLRSHGVTIGC